MKLHALALVLVAACGGQLVVEDAGDAASPDDASKAPDASKDVAPVDAVVLPDVSFDDDVAPSFACNIAKKNLVAYYPLDTDALDHSGHGNDATASTFLSTGGIQDAALYFDGTTTTLHVTSGTAMLTGPRTLCAWIRPHATTGAGQPIFWAGQTNAGDFYGVFSAAPTGTCSVTHPAAPYIDHWGSDCIEPLVTQVKTAQWSLVCYATDGGAVEASIDGNEGKATGSLYDYPLASLYIGSTLGNGTTTKASFDGDIDEVSVWSVRLQTSDLAALWNGGLGCTL